MKPTFFSQSSRRVIRYLLAVITVMLVVSTVAATAQTPPPINFVSGQLFSGVGHGDRIPGAANVYTFAVGDFNNDKNLDLLTVNDSNVWGLGLILGNGDGTFQPPIEVVGYDTYGAFGGIVAGDFNKDGSLDFAVLWLVGYGPVQLAVYLNDGVGHFTLSNNYLIGGTSVHLARALATADLNADGNSDLVVPDVSNSTVAVLYGKGDGTFQNPVEFPSLYTSTGVAIGDFNKDGKPDIVVAATAPKPYGGIAVLLNNGNGGFQSPVVYPDPGGVDNGLVAVADLNADGKLDVVESSENSNIAIFKGNGDGTFQAATTYAVPYASAIALGDLSGGKKPDIVATSYPDGTVWVLLNKGTGIFQISNVYSADSSAMAMVTGMSIALADFNGDKKLDFVAGNPAGQFVTVGLGNGDGTFRDSPHYNQSVGMWSYGIAAADFNRDGNLDLVQAGGGTGVGLSLMLGTSHGVFKAPTFIDLGVGINGPVTFVRALDVNADGKADIVCVNQKGVVVLLGLGTGKFKLPVTYPVSSSYPVQVYLMDVNGDGKLDIVTTNNDGTGSVLLNKGSGLFGTATGFASGTGAYPSAFALGDFNTDGKVDIVVGDFMASNLELLLGNGNGTFQAPVALSSPVRPGTVRAADFNKDGKLDLAIPSNDNNGSLAILLGNGNGTFSAGSTYEWFDDSTCLLSCAHYPVSLVAVDLNGDGNLDLSIAPRNPWYLTCGGYRCAEEYLGAVVYLGKGDGTFVEQSGWMAGISPSWVEAGDFNSDGMPDLAFASTDTNYGQTSITVLQNSTQPVSVSPLSIKFPAKAVGASNTQTVLLTNNQATATLNINSVAIGGANPADFSSKSACGAHLLPGAYCSISVTFSPTVAGSRSATLNITDSVGVQSVQLSGVGK